MVYLMKHLPALNDKTYREMVLSVPGEIANGHFPCSSRKHFRLSQPARHPVTLRPILSPMLNLPTGLTNGSKGPTFLNFPMDNCYWLGSSGLWYLQLIIGVPLEHVPSTFQDPDNTGSTVPPKRRYPAVW